MKLFLSLILFLSTTQAIAAITLINVDGASNSDIIANNSNSSEELAPIIYGGLAGSDCTSSDITSTCDSCALVSSTASMACNTNRIFGDLLLTIYFSSSSKTGLPIITTGEEGSSALAQTDRSNSSTVGSQLFISIAWDIICNAVAGADCDSVTGSHYKTLRLGVDADNDTALTSADDYTTIKFIVSKPTVDTFDSTTKSSANGINSLIVFPGDQKVYIESLGFPSSYPRVNSSIGIFKFQQVRIIYSTSAGSALPNDPANYTDLRITGEGEQIDVSPDLVEGLTNGQTYHFRFGSVDDAGNLSNVFSETITAQPSKTAGLLAEDINCFIATAAFGSTLDSRLNSLRQFRSQYLLNSEVGRKIVKLYYNYSPAMAEKIYHSKALKLIAQAVVWPVVFWVEAGLQYGFLIVNFLFLTLLTLSVFGYRRWQKC
ncbi:MAG: hypothetical protein MK008_03580 [Bdellovibrionales bacterium]|nr:hypothetical protein [Bdellovibrionales bacterium]